MGDLPAGGEFAIRCRPPCPSLGIVLFNADAESPEPSVNLGEGSDLFLEGLGLAFEGIEDGHARSIARSVVLSN